MTIFVVGSPYETAQALDPKRLNKQILECQWMIDMAEGKTKEKNHPAYLMYKKNIIWVKYYRECLIHYQRHLKEKKDGHNELADLLLKLSIEASKKAESLKPSFLCEELYNNFKKRLYTKNPEYYKKFESFGKTEANYYFVDGNWLKYENGNKEIDNKFCKFN